MSNDIKCKNPELVKSKMKEHSIILMEYYECTSNECQGLSLVNDRIQETKRVIHQHLNRINQKVDTKKSNQRENEKNYWYEKIKQLHKLEEIYESLYRDMSTMMQSTADILQKGTMLESKINYFMVEIIKYL